MYHERKRLNPTKSLKLQRTTVKTLGIETLLSVRAGIQPVISQNGHCVSEGDCQ